MSRRRGDHIWIAGDGPRGERGRRGDRCKRCGLARQKCNGKRRYFWSGEAEHVHAPGCDPKKLQRTLDLAPAPNAEGQAEDLQLVPLQHPNVTRLFRR